MVSELVFLLLIVGVLGVLLLSAFFQMHRTDRPDNTRSPSAVHQASYLRYLAYVPERSKSSGEEVLEADGSRLSSHRRATPDQDGVVSHEPAADPVAVAAAGGTPAPAHAEVEPASGSSAARSTLVHAAPSSSASLVLPENTLEVTVVKVTGDQQEAPPPASPAAGSSSGSGARLVGGRPQTAPAPKEATENSGHAASLLLIEGPAGLNASPAAQPAVSSAAGSDGRTRRVGSLRRLEFRGRGADVWKRWPDANMRSIVGTDGVDALNRAFDLLEDSDAHSIADDLFRKGITITFGDSSEFSGGHSHAAEFVYPATHPPEKPVPPPAIHLNPQFLHEDPRVLAALLAHEGTHLQQYLEGRLRQGAGEEAILEAQAWLNGGVVWQQVRRSALSIQTPLVRDLEVGYQVARQGEGLLRDFVAALYAH